MLLFKIWSPRVVLLHSRQREQCALKPMPQRALQIRGERELAITEDSGWGIAGCETENENARPRCHTQQAPKFDTRLCIIATKPNLLSSSQNRGIG